MDLNARANSGVRWTASRSVVTVVTSTAQVAVLARILDPEDFGLMAIVMIVISLANVFVKTGFSDALIAKDKPTPSQQATLYWANVILGFFVTLFLYFSAPLVASIFDQYRLISLIQYLSIVVFLTSITLQFEALLMKNLYFKELSLTHIVSAIIGVVTAITLSINDFGVWALVYSAIVIQLSNSLQFFYYAIKYKWLSRLSLDLKEVDDFLKFGYFRIGAALVNQINSRADQLIIGALLGPTILGYYAVAFQLIIQPMNKINPILTQISFPIFSVAKNDTQKIINGYRKGIRILTAINAPLLFGIAAIAPILIPLLLGEGWEISIIIVQILSIYTLLRSIGNVSVGVILAKEKYKWPFYWNLIVLAFTPLTLFIVASTTNSIIAVSVALMLLQVFLLIMNYFLYIRRLLGKILIELIDDLKRPVLSASLMGTCVYTYINLSMVAVPWVDVLIAVLLGAISYIVFSYFLQKKGFREVLDIVSSKNKDA